MKDSKIPNQETFDLLLGWLSPDRDIAGQKYEEIRRALIRIFTWRGISDAESLADETINVVAQKVSEVAPHYAGDPKAYFHSVGQRLLMAYERQQHHELPLEMVDLFSTEVPS